MLSLLLIISCSPLSLKGGNALTGNVVREPMSQEVDPSQKNICYEEDNGLNFDKRSVVTGSKDGSAVMKLDTCVENVLQEYFCDNGEIKLQNHICDNACYAGRCE